MHPTAPEPLPLPSVQATPGEISLPRNAWYSPRSFEVASRLIQYLPRRWTRALAAAVGDLSYRLCTTRREALLGNLGAFHDQERSDLCRACFQNFLMMLHDFCDAAEGGIPRINELIVDRSGFEFLDQGKRRGQGTLLITGHLGAWELGGMLLAAEGFQVNVVTMEEPTPELDAWRRQYRARFGIKTITVGTDKFAFVELIHALRRNELVAMLVDRPYLNSGVDVRFFGRETLFSAAAARIWQHTGATIIPAFVLQLQAGRYGCYAYPPIEMEPNATPLANTQRIAAVFEAIIREFPDQWFNFVPIWPPFSS
ncbi:MAG: lysophospholipid acyltransferase family protein [Verrucomicrobia bacterium]|nr:lysophospholipid acyltransferase family protein [Verrucomicrobiota bacterium]